MNRPLSFLPATLMAAILAPGMLQGAPDNQARNAKATPPTSSQPAAGRVDDSFRELVDFFGAAVKTASVALKKALVIGPDSKVYTNSDDNWTTYSDQKFKDIALGPNGVLWAVGVDGHMYSWDDKKGAVIDPGLDNAVRVALDLGENPYVVKGDNHLWRRFNNTWEHVRGGVLDITFGSDGNAWITDDKERIFKYDEAKEKWIQKPGAATRVAAGRDGSVWVVNRGGGVYRWDGSNWEQKGSSATDIAVGSHGAVWMVNKDAGASGLFQWDNDQKTWVAKWNKAAVAVALP